MAFFLGPQSSHEKKPGTNFCEVWDHIFLSGWTGRRQDLYHFSHLLPIKWTFQRLLSLLVMNWGPVEFNVLSKTLDSPIRLLIILAFIYSEIKVQGQQTWLLFSLRNYSNIQTHMVFIFIDRNYNLHKWYKFKPRHRMQWEVSAPPHFSFSVLTAISCLLHIFPGRYYVHAIWVYAFSYASYLIIYTNNSAM